MTITFSVWSLILLGVFVVLPALFVYVISIGMAINDLWLGLKQRRERERQRREFNLSLSRKRYVHATHSMFVRLDTRGHKDETPNRARIKKP